MFARPVYQPTTGLNIYADVDDDAILERAFQLTLPEIHRVCQLPTIPPEKYRLLVVTRALLEVLLDNIDQTLIDVDVIEAPALT